MATLSISEYAVMAVGADGHQYAPMALEPALADQETTFTTAAQSTAFNAKTRFVRLVASANCRVVFGSNPTALAASQRLVADVEYWRGVIPGHKVSVYDGSS